MLVLSDEDRGVLQDIAEKSESNGSEILEILIDGFSRFGEIEEGSREEYFRKNSEMLLTNIPHTGRTAVYFLDDRNHLISILTRLKVPSRDVEELADSAIAKFFKFQHAERYNPLKASWNHYIYVPLKRLVASYWEKRQRDPVAVGFPFQQFQLKNGGQQKSGSDDFTVDLYELNGEISVEDSLALTEVLLGFERYLKQQRPFREGMLFQRKKMCNLHPGKKGEVTIEEVTPAFLVRKGQENHRVELIDGKSFVWPKDLIFDEVDNPDHSWKMSARIDRSRLTVYRFIVERGAQVEEMAKKFKVGGSTAHSWVRKLEEDFRDWWLQSPRISDAVKFMAKLTRKCKCCGWEHEFLPDLVEKLGFCEKVKKKDSDGNDIIIEVIRAARKDEEPVLIKAHWCDLCGNWAVTNTEQQYEIPYPWGNVRGSHDLVNRASKYRERYKVPVCSMGAGMGR